MNASNFQSVFSFVLPTKIVFGPGSVKTISEHLTELGVSRPLIVTDAGVSAAGVLDKVLQVLPKSAAFNVFDKVAANPRDINVASGAEAYRAFAADGIIAIGGGSPMDSAKAIGTLLTHGGKVRDWCGRGLLKRDITPLIAIPTTAGTGSEVTYCSVITDTREHMKLTISDPRTAPKAALVDPLVLMNLPPHIMASTGIDAMTHAVEAYTCTQATPHSDAYAIFAIELVSKHLRNAVRSPDLASCTGMMLASNTAGIAFGRADVAGVHCMAEALGGMYDTPHGVANAALLPTVTEFNMHFDYEKHANIAKAMGVDINGMAPKEAAERAATELRKLCDDVGIPKIRDIPGISPDDFPALAEASAKNVSAGSNPGQPAAREFLELFKKAYSTEPI